MKDNIFTQLISTDKIQMIYDENDCKPVHKVCSECKWWNETVSSTVVDISCDNEKLYNMIDYDGDYGIFRPPQISTVFYGKRYEKSI